MAHVGFDTDTVEVTVKTLLSHLVTRKFNSPTIVLRTAYVRVEPYPQVLSTRAQVHDGTILDDWFLSFRYGGSEVQVGWKVLELFGWFN
eukprot:7890640-Pyramimonas_sp.AAC.1